MGPNYVEQGDIIYSTKDHKGITLVSVQASTGTEPVNTNPSPFATVPLIE